MPVPPFANGMSDRVLHWFDAAVYIDDFLFMNHQPISKPPRGAYRIQSALVSVGDNNESAKAKG
jgi:hypothetical protein